MKNLLFFATINLILMLSLASGCAPGSTPTMTVTIRGNECSVEGPMTVSYPKFTITLVLEQDEPSTTGYTLVTLSEGKTVEDLRAWTTLENPGWITNIFDEPHLYATASTTTRTFNLEEPAAYTGGPLYIECFLADSENGEIEKIGAFGPIEVKK